MTDQQKSDYAFYAYVVVGVCALAYNAYYLITLY